jgi:hypothetical protein
MGQAPAWNLLGQYPGGFCLLLLFTTGLKMAHPWLPSRIIWTNREEGRPSCLPIAGAGELDIS